MHQYVANRNVFRDCLKLFPPITGLCKLSGREFRPTDNHTESLSAVKAESVARYDWELSGSESEMLL